MTLATIGLLIIVLVFALFFVGVEIGFAMGIAGFIGFAWIRGLDAAFTLVANDVYSVFSSYGFSVISMFVLMGQIGASGGVAGNLYSSAYKFLGHIPGGLAIGTVAACTAFKAICGSAPATAATFATIAVPEMDKYGYDKRLSCGTVATVGTLGILIPPSTTLIIYGILTETSIGKLFLAGIIPGLIVAFSFVLTLLGWARINPTLGPRGEKSTWKERFASLPPVLPVGIIFVLVVGGLLKGFFTPTEAGSVGSFSVFVYLLMRKDMDFRRLVKAISESLLYGPCAPCGRNDHGPLLCSDPHPLPGCRVAREPGRWSLCHHAHHYRGIHHRRVCYRRFGLPHLGHPHFLPRRDETGIRPCVVWDYSGDGNYDRDNHSAHGYQRFCRIRCDQGADKCDL
jgi:C4-dicarboxylate transporter DctM subunit